MNKKIRIIQSALNPPIETVGNLILNLHVPYSDKEVTIQINPNLEEYIENQQEKGFEIIQMSVTTSTIDTKTLMFDFGTNNTHTFNYDDETYTISLLDIGIVEIEGQVSQYFEFLVQWNNSSEQTGGAIEFEIRPENNENNPVQFILDIGDPKILQSKRVSVLIDENFNLIFRMLDLDGKEFKLIQELCDYWKPDNWHRVVFSWDNNQVKLRLSVESDYNDCLNKEVDLSGFRTFHMWENLPCTIGANLEGKQNAKMLLSKLQVYSSGRI